MSVVLSLAPVFAVIVLGYALRRRAAVPESFCPAARGQRSLVLLARLAQLDPHVDQAGAQALAAAVDDLDIGRERIGPDVRAEIGDLFTRGDQASRLIKAAGRVEQAGVEVGNTAILRP